jgi:4'-phosphopantetheinyl transferase
MTVPFRAWSKHPENRCAPDEIPAYWKTHDVLTFLADTGMYNASLYQGLDSAEKEQVLQFKSDYFKKRFAVSRSLVKCILRHIPGTGNRDDIVLSRAKKGILVDGRQDIFMSLSYTGSCIAITVGKRKIGSDIERVRPVNIMKIRSSPLFDGSKCRNKKEESLQALHVWTLVEAYAKLRDRTPYPLLNSSGLLHDTSFVSYCVDQQAILSLAYEGTPMKDTLLWIDPGCRLASCGVENKADSLPPLIDGDTYVRA